ncbi:nuclear transport factor 2 family protein [Nakamurella lactea]|uniref:nuclear transport factor 2 family protein n=1 Tax=Nakamurella lactea TaxID=459515 RepID=UPI000416C2D8|nr:nuclear transport factor 2 family protein [Nakamurella lactea]
MTASEVLETFAAAIDARDWDRLDSLLAENFHSRFVHDGRTLDRAGFVRFNRDYPGSWSFALEDAVADGDRAVGRARVTDGSEEYFVASFITLDQAGLIAELTEVWTDGTPVDH